MDLNATLTELENHDWGLPKGDSYLIRTCHELRQKPLKDFTTEDLRIMIGQNISLKCLVPLAIEKLNENVLAEGDLYPGDLLNNVLEIDRQFWKENPAWKEELSKVLLANEIALQMDSPPRTVLNNLSRFLADGVD